MKVWIELDENNFAKACLWTDKEMSGNFVEGDESKLGKKWDGKKFVEPPKRYKIWSAVAFVTVCGKDVFKKIVGSADEDLQFFKYVLDKADIVDLNIPEYFNMVKAIKDRGILPQATFDILTALE